MESHSQWQLSGVNMGYYARGTGLITLEKKNLDKLFLTVRMMLNETDIMRGGVCSNGTLSNRSYAWVDSDNLRNSCSDKNLKKVFECWGFFIDPTNNKDEYIIDFDNKLGDEEIFLKRIAPFIRRGEIFWVGEDGCKWKHEYKEGQVRVLSGKTIYE